MADHTGIQAVTETLRQLLLERMAEPPPGPNVTTTNPDDDAPDGPRVNLFLYRIEESAELRNQQLPGRGSPGAYGHPPLSLDLHYLVTTGGLAPDDNAGAQQVLGDVMLTLHDHPIIAKDDPVLSSTLTGEVEQLTVTLEPLAAQELANIWTATTAPYRLSVAYKVTVIQLERRAPTPVARPVLEPPEGGPRIHVVPLDRPAITSVGVHRGGFDPADPTAQPQPVPYAAIGDTLAITGTSFLPGTRVLLGDADATADIDGASTATLLLVDVPDDPALQAGVHRVQLVRDVLVEGETEDDEPRGIPLLRSNPAAFVVTPSLTAVDGEADEPTLTITGDRLLADAGPTTVFIGNLALAPITEPPTTSTTTRLTVETPALPPGEHMVRVRVNGVEAIDALAWTVTGP